MERVRLIARPIGIVPVWAWDPLLGATFAVVRERGNAYIIEIADIVDFLRSVNDIAAREWRRYANENGRSEVRFPISCCEPA